MLTKVVAAEAEWKPSQWASLMCLSRKFFCSCYLLLLWPNGFIKIHCNSYGIKISDLYTQGTAVCYCTLRWNLKMCSCEYDFRFVFRRFNPLWSWSPGINLSHEEMKDCFAFLFSAWIAMEAKSSWYVEATRPSICENLWEVTQFRTRSKYNLDLKSILDKE